ncbi:MAG: asparagine synthase (glutamine-hydrolyzing) [Candidatus Omnitrophica bacterium]|nr:asparagine synthase (glutamine-hydrolyzing) [Candidatus Omnitrophota bacterium]
MCGIFGFCNIEDSGLADRVCDVIRYRGPDDFGAHRFNNFFLGHLRLSIIDLAGGHQPMSNEDNTVWIVYNGEIYNFQKLRYQLEGLGHVFKTKTDTEVIIHAYEQYGEECLRKLEGMFAFALLDEKNNRLFLARDRLGIKPLYYTQTGERLFFASELKAILQLKSLKREIDKDALLDHLVFRYSHSPSTVLGSVKKLPPAHFMIFENGKTRIAKYWDLSFSYSSASYRELEDELKTTFREVVQRHLVADVPVGVMLSGGIDSSMIAAYAAESMPKIATFCIGFEGQSDNEFTYARAVSQRFNTEHHELTVKPADIGLLPHIVWYNDEPVAGPSSLAYYLMLSKAKEYVKVVLFGHGADEIFCGYEQFKVQKLTQKYINIPLIKEAMEFISSIFSKIFKSDYVFSRLHKYVASLDSPAENYFQLTSVFNYDELSIFLNSRYPRPTRRLPLLLGEDFSEDFRWEDMLSFETKGWLADDLLHRVDRMSMANSLEGRVPYLDHLMVEFASRVPFDMKLKGLHDKFILRNSASSVLPKEIFNRPKQRFNTPIHSFFSAGYEKLCRSLFSEDNFLNSEVFNREALLGLLDFKKRASYRYVLRHNKLLAQFYARQVWNIVIFQMWYKMFIEGLSASRFQESLERCISR